MTNRCVLTRKIAAISGIAAFFQRVSFWLGAKAVHTASSCNAAVKSGDCNGRDRQVSIRLLDPRDPEVVAWNRKQRLRNQKTRAICPFAQDYSRTLRGWEVLLQKFLAAAVPQTYGPQILRQRICGGMLNPALHYREVDSVVGSPESPEVFVELKCRETSRKPQSGWSQLNKSLGIARQVWPNLSGLCVQMAMGRLLQTESEYQQPVVSFDQLSAALTRAKTCDGVTVWVCGEEVSRFGIAHGLLQQAEIDQLLQQRRCMLSPVSVLREAESEQREGAGLFEKFRHLTRNS